MWASPERPNKLKASALDTIVVKSNVPAQITFVTFSDNLRICDAIFIVWTDGQIKALVEL